MILVIDTGLLIALPLLHTFMEVIYILLSISILIAIGFLAAFIYTVKSGQYEDTVSPSIRILYEENLIDYQEEKNKKNINQKNINSYGTDNKNRKI